MFPKIRSTSFYGLAAGFSVYLFFCFAFFSSVSNAQPGSSIDCERISESLATSLKIKAFTRSVKDSDECRFEVSLQGDDELTLVTILHSSGKVASQKLKDDLASWQSQNGMREFEGPSEVRNRKYIPEKLALSSYWNEGFLIRSVLGGNHIVRIRKSRFNVFMLSDNLTSTELVRKMFELNRSLIPI